MNLTSSTSVKSQICAIALLVFVFALGAQDVQAQGFQWPEKSENLKVLPKNTSAQELSATMRGFTQALGVRCEHCHDDSDGNRLSQMDFAADTKEAKDIARVMLQMVSRINSEELTKLERTSSAPTLQVTCRTCHRGNKKPEFIEDVLTAETIDNGIEDGLARYHILRERYFGGFTYDFSERSLLRVAGQLEGEEMVDEAIAFMELNLEMYPESWQTYGTLAQTYQRMDDNTKALENAEKALALNPEAGFLKRLIAELKGE